jgi:hypothetical protein
VCRICERRIARDLLKTHSGLCALAEACNDKLRGNRTIGDRLESLIAAVQRERDLQPPVAQRQRQEDDDSDTSSSMADADEQDGFVIAELLGMMAAANECVAKQTICDEYGFHPLPISQERKRKRERERERGPSGLKQPQCDS